MPTPRERYYNERRLQRSVTVDDAVDALTQILGTTLSASVDDIERVCLECSSDDESVVFVLKEFFAAVFPRGTNAADPFVDGTIDYDALRGFVASLVYDYEPSGKRKPGK